MAHLIQDLSIDHLHVIGDIYDRGSGPHRIMDCIMKTENVDIQWGNHDILWMGAASGHQACICNVVGSVQDIIIWMYWKMVMELI